MLRNRLLLGLKYIIKNIELSIFLIHFLIRLPFSSYLPNTIYLSDINNNITSLRKTHHTVDKL